ncbi:MFS transporter [Paenibacillus mesophilus]|uniref:MFS transporter n=1 Tax=Paenibacillus mesophilus TaxID=2582849 RepID=UPI00110D6C91|nr:MFS transporter [Paenibacillus mesophilus]TMV50243.1 MFS transporter [Paenibacillus mesophilus]
MDRQTVRAWVMYDWANSAFATTMMAAVLPIFYSDVAASTLPNEQMATSYWGMTQSVAMLIVAVLTPILGAIADYSGFKVLFLRLFSYLGILASLCFVFVGNGDYLLASVLFILGTIGFSGGNAFYDALLNDLVEPEKRDYISSKGFAFGYIGGGVLLVLNLLLIQKYGWFGLPDSLTGTYISFASVALWWYLFSLPLFRKVKDRKDGPRHKFGEYTVIGFSRIWNTFKRITRYPELLKYLIAYWFFNDGISTIITMATIYGKEIGLGTSHLIAALVITQFVGIPFTLLFGKIAERLGSKLSLYISLSIYVLIVIFGYFMTETWQFYALAFVVGMVQGGSQSIARSIYSRLVPADRPAEFFGFLSVSSKFSAIVGPFVFSVVGLATGSSRLGILALVVFFIVGIALLAKVNLQKGAAEAEAAQA